MYYMMVMPKNAENITPLDSFEEARQKLVDAAGFLLIDPMTRPEVLLAAKELNIAAGSLIAAELEGMGYSLDAMEQLTEAEVRDLAPETFTAIEKSYETLGAIGMYALRHEKARVKELFGSLPVQQQPPQTGM